MENNRFPGYAQTKPRNGKTINIKQLNVA